MKTLDQKNLSWSAIGVAAFAVLAAAGISFAGGGEEETEVALPAATVTSAINTAVAAKAGNISGIEMETENGVTKVEVEIVAADGKNYEVGVNAQTGKIISVEEDKEDEHEGDEKGEMNEQNEKE